MKATKIFDNGRGDKFEVSCTFGPYTENWSVEVRKKPRGKRKFVPLVDKNSWEYRNVPVSERTKYEYREYLKEIPWVWVTMVMDELANKIRKMGDELYPDKPNNN